MQNCIFTQITQNALASLVITIRDILHSSPDRGSTAVGGEGVCKNRFCSTYHEYFLGNNIDVVHI